LTSDLRHWFHEIPVDAEISKYFCIEMKSLYYRWCSLPMGWSHSPRIAQSISWSMLLHNAPPCLQAGHAQALDSAHSPAFVTVRNDAGLEVGLITVWYDNFVIVAYQSELVDSIWANLERNRKIIGATWGEVHRYSPKEVREAASAPTLVASTGEPLAKRPPGFLGMDIAVHSSPRPREGDAKSHLMWRPSSEFVYRSRRLSEQLSVADKVTRQQVSKLVGRLVWNAYARGKNLHMEHEAIQLCRINIPAGMKRKQWHEPTPLSSAQIQQLCSAIQERITLEWTHTHRIDSRIILVSDSSGESGAYLELSGAGLVTRHQSWRWPAELQPASIFIKELVAAVRAIESLDKRVQQDESVAVDLVVDNTAVAHVIRRGLSTNHHASELLCRMHRHLPLERVRVHTVPSEANAADPLTRGRPIDMKRNLASVAAVTSSLAGWPKTLATMRQRDTGHEDDVEDSYEAEIDAALDLDDDVALVA